MNKTVVVTGASQGLGFCLVKEGIKRGYVVYALDINTNDELTTLKGCKSYVCDVTDYGSVQKCRKFIEEKSPSVDILFNIIFRQFDVNAAGVLRVFREFLPLIKKSQTKSVINISSEAGSIGDCWRKGEYGYCMSKAAQNMATRIMQNAYPEIEFHSIHPGWMITPQGMAGADGDSKPAQNPSDTAKKLYDMAENSNIDYLYCDFEGNKLNF